MELGIVAFALLFVAWREREHGKERRYLLDRIQAPKETAIASALENVEPSPLHVPFDNDEEYWKAVEERN